MNKYHNTKTVYDGQRFDSRKEAARYAELKLLLRAGEISGLKMQVPYELLPEQREAAWTGSRGAVHKGRLLEKPVTYYADFVYTDNRTGKLVVEDVKGHRTKDYIIKRKLMLYVHGIKVQEV